MNLVLNVLLSVCIMELQLASGAADRDALIQQARLAEQAERYQDMADAMKKVVETGIQLSREEINLFSVAYKNLVGARRSSWKTLSSLESQAKDEDELAYIRGRKETVEEEVLGLCNEVLDLLDDYLIPGVIRDDSAVFYLKMTGDYYRYMAEVSRGVDKTELVNESDEAYKAALDVSVQELAPSNPIRLELNLNYSTFLYDIRNDAEKACEFTKASFDAAAAELDTLSEESYKDSTVIVKRLRDNHDLWGCEQEA